MILLCTSSLEKNPDYNMCLVVLASLIYALIIKRSLTSEPKDAHLLGIALLTRIINVLIILVAECTFLEM
jgi:hypothetical protein